MSGTKAGALKAAQTIKEIYGEDHFSKIGRIGGQDCNRGGFAYDGRNRLEKLLGRPTVASKAGRVGGKISKRGKK